MIMSKRQNIGVFLGAVTALVASGCVGNDIAPRPEDTGGKTSAGGGATGGTKAVGGSINVGGQSATGGSIAAGGTTAIGGTPSTGGINAIGGVTSNVGSNATGGSIANGGTTSSGGTIATGGRIGTGGTSATGGTTTAGAVSATGGTITDGGAISTGGASSSGGTTNAGGTQTIGGATSTGSTSNTGGTTTTTGGAPATGGSATGGTLATGGAPSTGGDQSTGGVVSTGGMTSTGGVAGTGGSSQTGPGWVMVGPGLDWVSAGSGYDAQDDRMILFGGESSSSGAHTAGIMVLANASGVGGTPTWIQPATGGTPPQGRIYHSVLYDSTRNRLIVHGGCTGNCGSTLADTWALSNANALGATPQWSRISPDATVTRAAHAAGYDETNQRMIVFGGIQGYAGTDRNDTWVMAEDTNGAATWSQLTPQGTPPAARDSMAYYYDAASNNLIIFGGYTYVQAPTTYVFYNDVWVLSNANGLGAAPAWTRITPTGEPPSACAGATMVYDKTSDRALLFGGSFGDSTGNTTYFGDLWILEHPTGANGTPHWLSVKGSVPTPRSGHVAAYAPDFDRMIITAGYSPNESPNDTWVFAGMRQIN